MSIVRWFTVPACAALLATGSVPSHASGATSLPKPASAQSAAIAITAWKCPAASPAIRVRATKPVRLVGVPTAMAPYVTYAKKRYWKNGHLTPYGIGYIAEMAQAWVTLNKTGYNKNATYQYKYPGKDRVYDLRTTGNNIFSGSVHWESKANTASLSAHQVKVDAEVRRAGKRVAYVWSCVNPYTGAVNQMRWDKDAPPAATPS